MAIILALLAALSYGVADFVGGAVSRGLSAYRVAALGQAASVGFAVPFALLLPGDPTSTDLAWGAAAGIGSGMGSTFLYRGFIRGRMSVVAPVSGVVTAAVPALVGVVLDGGLSPLTTVGVALALPAIWLVAQVPDAAGTSAGSGLGDAVAAGLGFGCSFICLAQVQDGAGLWPIAMGQATSVVGVALLATAFREGWLPNDRRLVRALWIAPFGAAANVLVLAATWHGHLSVVAVITGLYPASTILLAALVLRERIHLWQGVGLGLAATAVALVVVG